jgi:exodeoxyribonuclease V alpha subunit
MSISITAFPEKVRFQRDGFCILSCKCEPHPAINNSKYISVKGHVIGAPESLIGQEVEFTGNADGLEQSQYGFTLSFTSYVINESIDYFWTNVSGVSKKSLPELFRRFGHAPDWLDDADYAAKLSSVSGIKAKTVKKVMERWSEYQGVRKLIEQLAPYDVSQKQVSAIYRHFGERATKVLSENPYRLTEVRGIGFQKADDIARKLGIDEYSEARKSAAIVYAMEHIAKDGHTAAHVEAIFSTLNEILIMPSGVPAFGTLDEFRAFTQEASLLGDSKLIDVMSDGNWFALQKYHMMDGYIFEAFKSISVSNSTTATIPSPTAIMLISEYDKGAKFKLGNQQRQAVFQCLTTPGAVSIVGYAGTGKSTVSKVVLNMLCAHSKIHHKEVMCCALSGVAANRIKTQSGFNAETIHSLLGYDGSGFVYNEDNPLPFSIVLLDEAGMVDTWLFYCLLKAIDFSRTKLIILGDPAQLMAVGSGQPFIDLLNSGLLRYTELTEIFRQSSDKALPVIAESIRKGLAPEIMPSYADVKFHPVYSEKGTDRTFTNNAITDKVLDIAYSKRWTEGLPSDDASMWRYISHLQVITPRKSSTLGAEDLNAKLRARMLPSSTSPVVFRNSLPMTHFDKVIHLRNETMSIAEQSGDDDKKVRVYNGQLGVVTHVNTDEQTITVRYPLNGYSIVYEEKDVMSGLIGHAWALTIHKTQGAEFNHVVIPLTMSHFSMLNNRLFYTGITRMKEAIDLVGEKRALVYAATNSESIKRMTVLRLFREKLKST